MLITALPPVTAHLIAGASAVRAGAVVFMAGSISYLLMGTAVVAALGLLALSPWMTWRLFGQYRRMAENLPAPVNAAPVENSAQMRLSAIVESSEDGIIGKDENGIVTTWNRSAERIFGYTAAEMTGRSIRLLLPPGREQEEEGILLRIKRGEMVDHFETVRMRKDGQLIDVAVTISPIRDGAGRIIGASKIVRDVTEMKQLQRQLHQSQKMEAVGQLTGGVAHDFNNLLAVIMGNLDLLEPLVEQSEAATRRVQIAQRAAIRGMDLTRRLLAFSRQHELRPAVTSLEATIQNTIELAARTLGPEISISTNLSGQVPHIYVDAAALENALLNLAVNARDAMPHGGSIVMSTYLRELGEQDRPARTEGLKPGTYACVSVSDSGEGMSTETLERVFEPFFTTKPTGKGTGLGLAMVYGFVKQSGGAIRMNSEPGYGTTVMMYLPLAEKASPMLSARMEKPGHSASEGRNRAGGGRRAGAAGDIARIFSGAWVRRVYSEECG